MLNYSNFSHLSSWSFNLSLKIEFDLNDTDSILHYIWLCPVVKLFLNRVKTWLEEIFDIPIELKMANIVFITNDGKRPIYIDGKPILAGIKQKLNNNSVVEVNSTSYFYSSN
jgi:hypothetical protein